MTGQTMIRLFLTLLLSSALAWSCSGKDLPTGSGLVFHQSFVDLGERWAGEQIELEFPFSVVDSEITIDSVFPECGCLTLSLWVEGQPHVLGTPIEAGAEGVLKVHYNTAGFRDRKFVGIKLTGAGEGLPARVEVRSWLRSWFELTPAVVNFGVIDGKEARTQKVEVRGQKPFRMTKLITQSPGLEIRGVPSATRSQQHVLEIVVPATTAEGRHAGFFSIGTDMQGYSFRLAVGYEVQGALWTVPDTRLLLGQVKRGVEFFSVIEVGAREGTLETPQVELIDLPGAEARVEKLATGGRYRVHLRLLPESAKINGQVVLSLPYTVDGRNETIQRRIQVLGVVGP
jgi:hypothetical protein